MTYEYELKLPATSGGGSSGGSSSGGSLKPGNSGSTVTTNPDGSKTETTTKPDGTKTEITTKPDGTKTETTIKPDGSQQIQVTSPNGDVTTTVDDKKGNVSEIVTKPDGSQQITTTKSDGTSAITTQDTQGKQTATVTLPKQPTESVTNQNTVTLPIPDIHANRSPQFPATVKIQVDTDATTKVRIPVTNAVPGTVAVLVHADGRKEILPTVVAKQNYMVVAISNDATIEIMDNSQTYYDVPETGWQKMPLISCPVVGCL